MNIIFLLFSLVAFLGLGLLIFRSVAGTVGNRLKKHQENYRREAAEKIDKMSLALSTDQLMRFTWISIIGLALLGYLIFRNPIMALLSAIIGYWIPKFMLKRMEKKRLIKFNEQLVDGITLISNSLRAGFSFLQALELLVEEAEPPLQEQFKLVLHEQRLGISLEKALTNLQNRVPSNDLNIVLTATLISRETGGNLAEVYDKINATIRERNIAQGKIQAMTSQGKMQGIITGLLPIFFALIMIKIEPDLMYPMFHTFLGWVFLAAVAFLDLIGFLLIKRIITVDI